MQLWVRGGATTPSMGYGDNVAMGNGHPSIFQIMFLAPHTPDFSNPWPQKTTDFVVGGGWMGTTGQQLNQPWGQWAMWQWAMENNCAFLDFSNSQTNGLPLGALNFAN